MAKGEPPVGSLVAYSCSPKPVEWDVVSCLADLDGLSDDLRLAGLSIFSAEFDTELAFYAELARRWGRVWDLWLGDVDAYLSPLAGVRSLAPDALVLFSGSYPVPIPRSVLIMHWSVWSRASASPRAAALLRHMYAMPTGWWPRDVPAEVLRGFARTAGAEVANLPRAGWEALLPHLYQRGAADVAGLVRHRAGACDWWALPAPVLVLLGADVVPWLCAVPYADQRERLLDLLSRLEGERDTIVAVVGALLQSSLRVESIEWAVERAPPEVQDAIARADLVRTLSKKLVLMLWDRIQQPPAVMVALAMTHGREATWEHPLPVEWLDALLEQPFSATIRKALVKTYASDPAVLVRFLLHDPAWVADPGVIEAVRAVMPEHPGWPRLSQQHRDSIGRGLPRPMLGHNNAVTVGQLADGFTRADHKLVSLWPASTPAETARNISARMAEKAVLHLLSSAGPACTVEDIAITQLQEGTTLHRVADLRRCHGSVCNLLDVKNARVYKNRPQPEFVIKRLKGGGQPERWFLAGVVSPYLGAARMDDVLAVEDAQASVGGRASQDRAELVTWVGLASEARILALEDIGARWGIAIAPPYVRTTATRERIPLWLFDYEPTSYAAFDEEVLRWLSADPLPEVPPGRWLTTHLPMPGAVYDALSPIQKRLYDMVVLEEGRLHLSALYLHLLCAGLTVLRDGGGEQEILALSRLVSGAGIVDPCKTIKSLLWALKEMARHWVDLSGFADLKVTPLGIVKGKRGRKTLTLMAWCGGCGQERLVYRPPSRLGGRPPKNCGTCGYLVCSNPECLSCARFFEGEQPCPEHERRRAHLPERVQR